MTVSDLIAAWINDQRAANGEPPIGDSAPIRLSETHNALKALAEAKTRKTYIARLTGQEKQDEQ